MNNKIDKNFVLNNKESISKKAVEKAIAHHDDAELLIKNERYSAALCSTIESLEEVAKASLIKREDFSNLLDLINHGKKAAEIMYLSAECYHIPMPSEEDISWAQKTIPQIREDATYTRLVPNDNRIESKWEEKAKRFYDFDSEILKKLQENPNIIEVWTGQEKNTIRLPGESNFIKEIRDSASTVANFIKEVFKID